MAYKKFVRSDSLRERPDRPEVAVWKKGSIAFTKAAEEEYGIKNYRYAVLYYDEKNKKVAIELMKERGNPQEQMAITPGRSNITISAAPFFKEFGIKIESTKRYILEKEDNYLVFKLDS